MINIGGSSLFWNRILTLKKISGVGWQWRERFFHAGTVVRPEEYEKEYDKIYDEKAA